MQSNETWKWVVGFESLYSISDKGNIQTFSKRIGGVGRIELCSTPQGLMYQSKTQKGYKCVCLRKNKQKHHKYISHLVLEAFPDPTNPWFVGAVAMHGPFDGGAEDKTNNNRYNLRWGTKSENARLQSNTKLSPSKVASIFKLYHVDKITQQKIADNLGVNIRTINRVLSRKSWGDVVIGVVS